MSEGKAETTTRTDSEVAALLNKLFPVEGKTHAVGRRGDVVYAEMLFDPPVTVGFGQETTGLPEEYFRQVVMRAWIHEHRRARPHNVLLAHMFSAAFKGYAIPLTKVKSLAGNRMLIIAPVCDVGPLLSTSLKEALRPLVLKQWGRGGRLVRSLTVFFSGFEAEPIDLDATSTKLATEKLTLFGVEIEEKHGDPIIDDESARMLQERAAPSGETVSEEAFRKHLAEKHDVVSAAKAGFDEKV